MDESNCDALVVDIKMDMEKGQEMLPASLFHVSCGRFPNFALGSRLTGGDFGWMDQNIIMFMIEEQGYLSYLIMDLKFRDIEGKLICQRSWLVLTTNATTLVAVKVAALLCMDF